MQTFLGEPGSERWNKCRFHTGHRPKDLGRCYRRSDSLFKELEKKSYIFQKYIMVTEGTPVGIYGGAQGWDIISFWAGVRLREENSEVRLVLSLPCEEQPLAWIDKDVAEVIRFRDKEEYPRLRDHAEAYMAKSDFWGKDTLTEYFQMLDEADEVIYVDTLPEFSMKRIPAGSYHVAKLSLRNKHMAKYGKVGAALWNGNPGGTANCIQEALALGRKVYRLDPRTDKVTVSKED